MPQRSFKSMFVELVSFLTLFTLVGTMSSNFWERYLIQNELSSMKSSLHVLKETIFNIGTAYDTLNQELKGLVEMREMKSSKLLPRDSKYPTCSERRNCKDIDVFSNKVLEELIKLKGNKSIGIPACKGTANCPSPHKDLKFDVQNAATITRYPLKTTGVNSEPEKTDSKVSLKNCDGNNSKEDFHTKIHRCCKEANCCKDPYKTL